MAELFADVRCSPSCTRAGIHGIVSICPPDCFQYKSTLDVFYKIIRQEGFARLWRGTNAVLALAVPTVGIYLPCYAIFRNWLEEFTAHNAPSKSVYVPLVAGSSAHSLACTTCYPIELAGTRMQFHQELEICGTAACRKDSHYKGKDLVAGEDLHERLFPDYLWYGSLIF